MVQSNVHLGPGQPLSEPFFRRYSILEDIWDYRLKWVTVYIYIYIYIYVNFMWLIFIYLFTHIDGAERLWLNSQRSEQTVLTENLRSILTQLKISIAFWLNWNDSWYFVVSVFCGFFKFVIKIIMRQRSILHECVKKQLSIFHSEKGMFPFIVTANYHIFPFYFVSTRSS